MTKKNSHDSYRPSRKYILNKLNMNMVIMVKHWTENMMRTCVTLFLVIQPWSYWSNLQNLILFSSAANTDLLMGFCCNTNVTDIIIWSNNKLCEHVIINNFPTEPSMFSRGVSGHCGHCHTAIVETTFLGSENRNCSLTMLHCMTYLY